MHRTKMNDLQKCRPLKPGVYGPLPVFFDEKQELDLVSYKKHLLSTFCSGSLQHMADLDFVRRFGYERNR